MSHQIGSCEGPLVFLVEEQPNPSTEYFVLPALLAGGARVVRCGPNDLPAVEDLAGTTVVFMRYVPSPWVKLVESARSRLGRLVFFMDDDVLDVRASVGMPLRYRFKLARLAAWRKGWLRRQGVDLWVSTRYLQQKYAEWYPRLVLPSPSSGPADMRRVFYHGSASHKAEIRWLLPVMEEALQRDERLAFEIVGGRDVYRLYRGLPRVNVVHPMRWPAYQAFLAMPGRHIGLAPLLNSPFNRARSYTKFFDITRCGAVGIYSPGSASADVVSHGIDGVVTVLEQSAWVEVILTLAHDEVLRSTMLRNAETKLLELADKARFGYSGLMDLGKGDGKD